MIVREREHPGAAFYLQITSGPRTWSAGIEDATG